MSVTVLLMSLVVEQLWKVLPGSPYFGSASACGITFCIMVLGGLIAFLMVWVEFKVIQETSALTFMVAGTFKELVTGEALPLPVLSLHLCTIPSHCCPRVPAYGHAGTWDALHS